jgi:dolichol kinase
MHESWLIVLLSMLYGGVLALALSEWMRHPGTRYLNRWVWLSIVILFSLVGPLAYLLLGNERTGRQE